MPNSRFSGSLSGPDVSVSIDMGHPFLNHTVDGFLKIGAIAATRALAEDVFHIVKKGSISSGNVEHTLKKMCKEGAYWGTVAGVYVGMDYGIERVRGTRDWKNAMMAGALTGAVASLANNQDKDKIFINAITGGAIATASEFINYLT
ncbi:outer envelope pore protein 16, chloroplastic [Humulus lupulus]|uniref:outer envelope pore protein 16, chloroplastic n=1 Tax=Humulus lupulus TaxID=3486 RepID=UPI002B4107E1|nr:outer envelope pore protein 16, chloroplastic [Humulus lupulus]